MPRPRPALPRRPWRLLAASTGLVALLRWLPASRLDSVAFLSPAARSSEASESQELPRRGVLASALAAAGSGLLSPAPARAEQGWQLKLPRTWRTFEQNEPPPPEVKSPTALVVAGNPEQGGELAVLRVPLSTAKGDPNAAASQDLINYFTAPAGQKPAVDVKKAVDALASSQKTQPGLTKFSFLGNPVESTKESRRYIGYDYESSLCQGVVTKGVKGDSCEAPEDGSQLPLYERRHGIVMTVTDEGSKAAGKEPTYFLWLLDISGPAETTRNNWGPLSEAVKEVSDSFLLADEAGLEKARTVEVTPEELEALKQLQKDGKLPQDQGF